jgi:hypothetical protein
MDGSLSMTMFKPREYQEICGVCREEWTYEYGFVSALTDHHGRIIASGHCPQNHTNEEIHAAYDAGFPALVDCCTRSTIARAKRRSDFLVMRLIECGKNPVLVGILPTWGSK